MQIVIFLGFTILVAVQEYNKQASIAICTKVIDVYIYFA